MLHRLGPNVVAVCLSLALAPLAADEVRFDEQNFMAGELKRLERGLLYFDTPATGSIPLEWDKVTYVTSSQQLEIELADGQLLYGSLVPSQKTGELLIQRHDDVDSGAWFPGRFVGALGGSAEPDAEPAEPGGESAGAEGELVSQPMMQIVRITPIEEEFLERFDGSVGAGLALTKANDYRQYNLGIDLEYLTAKYYSTLDASALVTDSEDSEESEQKRLQIRTSRRFADRWYSGGLLALESNEATGIDLRSSAGIAVGRNILNTNSIKFLIDGGVVYTKEEIANSGETNSSTEGFIGFQYEWFRYDDPEFDLTTQLRVIPSLSESGRVRGNLSVVLSWEIFDDFNWQLSFYDIYDNKPPGVDASTNDYSVVTGIAWDL